MATSNARRRGHGEDAIYFDPAKNRYIGAVSLGYEADGRRVRRKVSGKIKQEVRHKLKELHSDLDACVHSLASYRHELRPVVTSGAEMMNRIFAEGAK